MTDPSYEVDDRPRTGTKEKETSPNFSIYKAVQTVLTISLVTATLFSLWTPANLFTGQIIDTMLSAVNAASQSSTPESQQNPANLPASNMRIGIIAGHWKDTRNTGFVCSDGYAENQINLQIATLVSQGLSELGYQVDLLEEFDPRLTQYKALAVVSIHNDTCEFLGNESTGFKVAPALANAYPDNTNRLSECLVDRYATRTGLVYQTNKLTTDMTTYHSFNEIHSSTPIVVIETGYLNLDRQILSQDTEVVANGIIDGILCYLGVEIPTQGATITP